MKLKAIIEGYEHVSEDTMNLYLEESGKYTDSIELEFNNQSIHVPKEELLKAVKVFNV